MGQREPKPIILNWAEKSHSVPLHLSLQKPLLRPPKTPATTLSWSWCPAGHADTDYRKTSWLRLAGRGTHPGLGGNTMDLAVGAFTLVPSGGAAPPHRHAQQSLHMQTCTQAHTTQTCTAESTYASMHTGTQYTDTHSRVRTHKHVHRHILHRHSNMHMGTQYIDTHSRVRTCEHAHGHTVQYIDTHIRVGTCVHSTQYTDMHSRVHTCMCAHRDTPQTHHTDTQQSPHTHACTQAHTTQTHSRTHTRMRAHRHIPHKRSSRKTQRF